MTIRSEASQLERTAQAEAEDYRQGQERPLSGYVVVMAVFAALVAAAGSVAALTGRNLPRRVGPYDLLLITLGTHKLARSHPEQGPGHQPASGAVHPLPGHRRSRLMFAPQFTRIVGATFTARAGADFLHLAYARAQQSAEG